MKILWHSNAPWANTGYGVQTRLFTEKLADEGHEIAISSIYGLQGASLNLGKVLVLPGGTDTWGNEIVQAHQLFYDADAVISLLDVWVLRPEVWSTLPWIAWTPVDHKPIPTHVTDSLLNGNAVPWAMSRFGEEQMRKVGLDPLYVPHGYDPGLLVDVDRKDIRERFGWSDRFVMGMVAANKGFPCRKAFPEVLEAFSIFQKEHDEALLYLHTNREGMGGVDFLQLIKRMDIPETSILFVDQYKYLVGLGTPYMRDVYNAMDVFLNPSLGEGFGIPIIEAQACGTPAIVTDWTSMTELCEYGIAVGGNQIWSEQSAWRKQPDIGELVDAMRYFYDNPKTDESILQSKQNMQKYHPETVFREHMEPALDIAYQRIQEREDLTEE